MKVDWEIDTRFNDSIYPQTSLFTLKIYKYVYVKTQHESNDKFPDFPRAAILSFQTPILLPIINQMNSLRESEGNVNHPAPRDD